MPTELSLLVLTILLAILQIAAATFAKRTQDGGLAWGMGPRDTPPPYYTGIAGRISRAADNLLETLPLFAVLVLAAHLLGREGRLTYWGCELFFWSRVVYMPAYILGIPQTRSIIYTVSLVGLGLLFAAVLPGVHLV